MRPVLCLVTDRARFGGDDRLVDAVRRAAASGVHLVQVREPDLDARALCRLTARCLEASQGTRTRVLVNDRLDVAIAVGAHGVHLPGHGVPASRLRAAAPPGFLVGRSVHAPDEARRVAGEGGLDYLLFGTVFATESKPGRQPAGLALLSDIASTVALPVLAIGGVTLERLPRLAAAGAAGFAAIGLFADASVREAALERVIAEALRVFDTPGSVP